MKKTIFAKLMHLSLSIVLMTVFISGTIHFFLIQDYLNNVKTDQLEHEMDRLEQMTNSLVANYSSVTHTFYQMYIDDVANNNSSYIFVADKSGNILMISKNAETLYPDGMVDIKAYGDIVEGQTKRTSGFITSTDGTRLLAVTSGINVNGGIGIVSILVDVPLINKETYSMMSLLLISVGLSTLLSLILSYFLSMNMSKPIKRLSISAKEIAKGDFSKRSVVSGVAELDELGTAFDKMARELDKQEKSRTDFLANVSHDLRTPMTTISGFVQGILDDTIPPEREKEYLKVVLSETNRLSDLINMFLDANRYEAGEIKLNLSTVDINEMLRTVVLQYEAKLNEKRINVHFDIDTHSAPVVADQQAINRVIVNLMDNAVKFCSENGTISVTSMHKGKKVYVSIENTGDGISNEDINYIWDRFYKTDKSRVRDKNGIGLGLYIVKNIISQHGEQINVESSNGATKFTFTLQSKA